MTKHFTLAHDYASEETTPQQAEVLTDQQRLLGQKNIATAAKLMGVDRDLRSFALAIGVALEIEKILHSKKRKQAAEAAGSRWLELLRRPEGQGLDPATESQTVEESSEHGESSPQSAVVKPADRDSECRDRGATAGADPSPENAGSLRVGALAQDHHHENSSVISDLRKCERLKHPHADLPAETRINASVQMGLVLWHLELAKGDANALTNAFASSVGSDPRKSDREEHHKADLPTMRNFTAKLQLTGLKYHLELGEKMRQ